jgi:sugar lactone lactonase YvrE
LFVANAANDTIVKIPAGSLELDLGTPQVFVNRAGGGPDGLIIDEDNKLWAGSTRDSRWAHRGTDFRAQYRLILTKAKVFSDLTVHRARPYIRTRPTGGTRTISQAFHGRASACHERTGC